MVRKSDRNKASAPPAAAEKPVIEKGRKTRNPRRRKKSSSESEGEAETHVEKEAGEVSQPAVETDSSSAESMRSRRATRRQAQLEKQPENDQATEWKEDPSFWGVEEATAQETPAEEGTTWKVQSSNGSTGEIQKIKICRQRVSESTDSSSSQTGKDSLSPRRKKETKTTDSSADVSSPNDSKEDSRTESVDSSINQSLGPESEKAKGVETNLGDSKKSESDSGDKETATKELEEQSSVKEENTLKSESEETESSNAENTTKVEEKKSKIDNRKSKDEQGKSKPNEKKVKEEDKKSKDVEKKSRDKDKKPKEDEKKDKVQDEKSTDEESNLKSEDCAEETNKASTETSNSSAKLGTETQNPPEASSDSQQSKPANSNEEIQVSESNNNVEQRLRTKSESSDDGKKSKKVVKVPVNSEDAMDEIAKKLNERAARLGKEPVDSQEKSEKDSTKGKEKSEKDSTDGKDKSENDSTEGKEKSEKDSADGKENQGQSTGEAPPPQSPREEGELTPPPEPKKSHSTIIINRPKEINTQPTKLRRNTDERIHTDRKRRILTKPKIRDKEEDPINISSQSLMLLVPEVKTITPEQVASFPLDTDHFPLFDDEDDVPEVKVKKKIDLKPKDMEVRVENDTRQVVKKKPIVIDTKSSPESKPVGPKLPSQDNHRVVRKISLLSEDSKKVRRSPSPGGRSPTEVLFITNLVRPFTVPQLRELLARTGTIAQNGFYIDKIKSKCYVKYTDVEMAVETRHALNGVRWPVNNPKTLRVEFAKPEDMAIVQKLADEENAAKKVETTDHIGAVGWLSEQAALKPQRRVTTAVREWDMGKIGAGIEDKKTEDWRVKQEGDPKKRQAPPTEPKYEPPPRKMKKRDNDAPAKLLDDLFRKTKVTPCIYWLPLTAEQIAVKEEIRRQHIMAENERRLAEMRKTDHPRREKDRDKSRDRRKK